MERIRWEAACGIGTKLKHDSWYTHAGRSFFFHDPSFGCKLANLGRLATIKYFDSGRDTGRSNYDDITARRRIRPEL